MNINHFVKQSVMFLSDAFETNGEDMAWKRENRNIKKKEEEEWNEERKEASKARRKEGRIEG